MAEARSSMLSKTIHSKRVMVCCGSGGVGKTTTSASIAIRAALEGRNAVVITIDPAKRLATSLGLKELSNTPTDLTPALNAELKALGEPQCKGKLFAVMPDTTKTFEGFVRAMAGKDQNLATRVLQTSIYKVFAKEFSGTNEYMAMEKLYELHQESQFDLIVLDTPPSANTRLFLEAPDLLAGFFDETIMKWLRAPGSKLLAGGLRKLMEVLERLTGRGFVSELIEFTESLFALRGQVLENLKAVNELLHGSDVSFLMVTSPERLSKQDTQDFVRIISERGYPFWGFVVNRVLSKRLGINIDSPLQVTRLAAEQKSKLIPPLSKQETDEAEAAFNTLVPTLELEQDCARFLKSLSGSHGNVTLVSEQPTDVHSMGALLKLSLFD